MERVFLKDHKAIVEVTVFLERYNLVLDTFIDEFYVLRNGGAIIATGAIYENVIKCVAVEEHNQGTNTINTVMSYLTQRCYELGHMHLFIYTKPAVYRSFEYFGFKKIASSENVILMERAVSGFDAFMNNLSQYSRDGRIGGIVVNCNPFTLGHQYLIEEASKRCDWVHVFVVWQDQSTFPRDIRFRLIEAGTSHLQNVILHKVPHYIISSATFPSYFLKSECAVLKEHVALDLDLFGRGIAPALNITTRFVGEEPFSGTTRTYNEGMKRLLPTYGIQVVELKRKQSSGEAISASAVRRLLTKDDYDSIKRIVPKSTYDYLVSEEAQLVIENLKNKYSINNLV
ncbi:MAG: [citrate (pro-3S)-lyase] ligase [Clostridia bacterium]|nr:[citrate (pro-3S)-lyase] ligase [Clostridia bacterium]